MQRVKDVNILGERMRENKTWVMADEVKKLVFIGILLVKILFEWVEFYEYTESSSIFTKCLFEICDLLFKQFNIQDMYYYFVYLYFV